MGGTPHDRFVKEVFSRRECAIAQFHAFLPAALRARLDLESLELVSASFVDEALREHHADLLFRTRVEGHEAFVYLLFEHQSTVDHWMAFRVQRYVMRIWARCLEDDPGRRHLPRVLPMVLYAGGARWWAPTNLRELQRPLGHAPDSLVATAGFVLVDLSVLEDESLLAFGERGAALPGLALLTLKHVRAPDFVTRLTRWAGLVRTVLLDARSGLQALETLVRYVLEANDEVDAETLGLALAKETTERVLSMTMSAADKLREEGRAKGRDEGRVEGRVEGRTEGAREILLRLLRARFGQVGDDVADRVRAAGLEKVAHWSDRLLSAGSLDDVFAD